MNSPRVRQRERRNNSNRPAMKSIIRKLAKYSHCSAHDEKFVLLKTIQRLELLEHVNETLEDQIRTLILASLQNDTVSESEPPS